MHRRNILKGICAFSITPLLSLKSLFASPVWHTAPVDMQFDSIYGTWVTGDTVTGIIKKKFGDLLGEVFVVKNHQDGLLNYGLTDSQGYFESLPNAICSVKDKDELIKLISENLQSSFADGIEKSDLIIVNGRKDENIFGIITAYTGRFRNFSDHIEAQLHIAVDRNITVFDSDVPSGVLSTQLFTLMNEVGANNIHHEIIENPPYGHNNFAFNTFYVFGPKKHGIFAFVHPTKVIYVEDYQKYLDYYFNTLNGSLPKANNSWHLEDDKYLVLGVYDDRYPIPTPEFPNVYIPRDRVLLGSY